MYEYYIKKSCVSNLWTIMKAITWREVENTSVEGTNFENELSN